MIDPMAVMEDPSILVAMEAERDSLKAALSAARAEVEEWKLEVYKWRTGLLVLTSSQVETERNQAVAALRARDSEAEKLRAEVERLSRVEAAAKAIFNEHERQALVGPVAGREMHQMLAELAAKILQGLGPDGREVKP